MSNQKMLILHTPSGNAAILSKRGGWGWYGVDQGSVIAIDRLMEWVEHNSKSEAEGDAFALVFEGDPRICNVMTSK